MTTLNLEYAQDHLAELVEKAGNGESFVITKGGTPIAQLISISAPAHLTGERTVGFLDGQFSIPDDVKAIDREEIIALFEGNDKQAAQPEKPRRARRTGFMQGQIKIPDDFDTMGSEEIERLFEFGE